MVTLKDIARECNVSFSTVSKALKNSSEISAETINLIQNKAKEMGYFPNFAARTLRTNRTYDIGVIFEDKTGAGFQHEYFATIISGIQKVAQEKGYEMTFLGTAKKNYDYFQHVLARNYDGVAILTCNFESDGIKNLVFSNVPTVTLDYAYDDVHSAIMSDSAKGVSELVEYAIKQGHSKIAMIYGENTLVTQQRKTAFLETCRKNGVAIPQEYFAEALYHDPITSSEATNYLLSLPEPPTCIFYPDDYSALGGMRAISAHNLVLGKDISIVGYDGIMLTKMMIPALTTYEQNGEQIGRKMAENLISNIEKTADYKAEKFTVNGRLLKGETVAKV